jgi:hypothetical protein
MYAYLNMTSNTHAIKVMSLIAMLCTNSSPTIPSVNWLSNTSTIVDSTPAGWTYVRGTTSDYASIADVYTNYDNLSTIRSIANNAEFSITLSSPCASNTSVLKYAEFNVVNREYGGASDTCTGGGANGHSMMMSTCLFANSSTVVDRTHIFYQNLGNSIYELDGKGSLRLEAGEYHLIASNSHITLIRENMGFNALWESQGSDFHLLHNTPPVACVISGHNAVMLGDTVSAAYTAPNVTQATTGYTTTQDASPFASTTGIYDNIRSYYKGSSSLTYITESSVATDAKAHCCNSPNLYATYRDPYQVTRLANNAIRAQVVPISYNVGYGYPQQVVTGTTPIFYTSEGIGVSGDTIDINGEEYTWFNPYGIGIALKTS